MTRFERVKQILDASIGGSTVNIGMHGAFWRRPTRDQFVEMSVVGRKLLTVGQGADSNLVKALKGEAPFGADLDDAPAGASFRRMPAGRPPVSDKDIAFIQQWIDDGCPEDALEDEGDDRPVLRWSQLPNAPIASSRTDDIFFVDPLVGWAVNSNGTIVQTRDGGESWTDQFQDVPPVGAQPVYFRCLAFASPERGWAGTLVSPRVASPVKRLFETKDGGESWSEVLGLPALAPQSICGIYAVNGQVVYASGTNFPDSPPRMMKTVDGGETWTAWEMKPFADILIDCYFTSPTRGWVVGGKTDRVVTTLTRDDVKPVVLLTEDGGQTWVNTVEAMQDQFPHGEWGWKIQFLDERVGFVALENFTAGAILKTLDGGQTWTRLPVNDPQANANLQGIGFLDERHGWVGGWGDADFFRRGSSETLDGGLTWRDANEIGLALNRFRFFGKPVTVGYASGDTIYKYAPAPADGSPARDGAARAAALASTPGRIFDRLDPVDAEGAASLNVDVPPGARRLAVYVWDSFGDHVRTVVDEVNPAAGRRSITWDGRDETGRALRPGYFIWRAVVDDAAESRLVRMTR